MSRDPNLDLAARHPDQSFFTHGRPHYSADHANHRFGSTALVQEDLQLRNPHTGKVMGDPIGMPFSGQTTLDMFK